MHVHKELEKKNGEAVTESFLRKALLISQIFAMVAIPVILAIVGYFLQNNLQGEQIKRDYVSLAIQILAPSEKDKPEAPLQLREWAVNLLDDSSPVRLSNIQKTSIVHQGLGRPITRKQITVSVPFDSVGPTKYYEGLLLNRYRNAREQAEKEASESLDEEKSRK
jgi:hypothetical protein